MTDKNLITQQYLLAALEYRVGELFWRVRPVDHFLDEWRQKIFNSRQAGSRAGTNVGGYRLINFSRGRIGAHRAIFLMHHGFLPLEVDHINGNPLDNRIDNLRAATHAQNLKNMKTPASNTSGIKGVYWHKATKKWTACIREGGKFKHLGTFLNKEDAAAARRAAELSVYKEFSNGR